MGARDFDAYAVRTRWGPHVTLQAGVVHLGRYWTTTTRQSVKVRAIRRLGWASTTVEEDGAHRVVGGPAHVLDPSRPWTYADAPVDAALAGGAILRLGAGQLDQLLGYAEAGNRVPDAFKPWGRVILVTDIHDSVTLEGDRVRRARGRWSGSPTPLALPRRTRAAGRRMRIPDEVPEDVARLAGLDGPCWLGLTTAAGAVTVPAEWDAASGRVHAGRGALETLAPVLPGPVCVTVHESSRRRPDQKIGLMLRGEASSVDADARRVALSVREERITYWQGFVTRTVDAKRR